MSRPAPAAARARPRSVGFSLVALAGVLWGTGGAAGAMAAASSEVSWLAISSLRLGVGGTILLAVATATGAMAHVPRSPAVVRRVLATAFLSAVYQGSYFLAIDLAGVALSTVVALGSAPVLVAAVTAVARRRLPPGTTLVALGAALAGLVLLVGAPSGGASGPVIAGALLACLSGASFAGVTLLNRRPVPGLPPVVLVGVAFTLAGAMLVPGALVTGFAVQSLTATSLLWVGYLGLGPTALAYVAYYSGLRVVPATTATILALLEPLTATVLAIAVLGEALTLPGIAGMALLLGAVVLLGTRRSSRPPGDVQTSDGGGL